MQIEDFFEKQELAIDTWKLYLDEVAAIPLLSPEEERQLGRIIAEGGPDAKEARNKLISANLKLVLHYAKRYTGRGVDLEDLNAMGCEGLIKAAEKFDYTLGHRFSTYATWWIKQSISRGIVDEAENIRVPVHVAELVYKVRRVETELAPKFMVTPSVKEIAEHIGISEEKVIEAMTAMQSTISFAMKLGEDEDMTVEDVLADKKAVDPCEEAVRVSMKEAIEKVLGMLTIREALVLKLRYGVGIDEPMTLEEIGALPEFEVSRERIRQIEEKALRKIRRTSSMRTLLEEYRMPA